MLIKTAVPPGREISINLCKYYIISPNLPGTEEATAFCRALESRHRSEPVHQDEKTSWEGLSEPHETPNFDDFIGHVVVRSPLGILVFQGQLLPGEPPPCSPLVEAFFPLHALDQLASFPVLTWWQPLLKKNLHLLCFFRTWAGVIYLCNVCISPLHWFWVLWMWGFFKSNRYTFLAKTSGCERFLHWRAMHACPRL